MIITRFSWDDERCSIMCDDGRSATSNYSGALLEYQPFDLPLRQVTWFIEGPDVHDVGSVIGIVATHATKGFLTLRYSNDYIIAAMHRRLYPKLVLELREQAARIQGQLFIHTACPYLLDNARPNEDQVIIARRTKDGKQRLDPIDWDRVGIFLDEFKLGEVWYNEGEDGLVAEEVNKS